MEDCHIFAGSHHSCGYGVISVKIDGKWRNRVIHKIVYENAFGEIPKGLVCDHICRNRLCINLDHLQVVTNAENLMLAHTRRAYCKRGHEFDDKNTYWQNKTWRRCRACRKFWEKNRKH